MTLPTTDDVVARTGTVFAVFDERSQDSGHVSYGVRTAVGRKVFVKTAGGPEVSPGGATREQRAGLLRRDAQLHAEVDHPGLVPVLDVVDTVEGVAVVSDWFDGLLLHEPAERREDPSTPRQRFMGLPPAQVVAALDTVVDLHVAVEDAGWVVGDFYDGALMHDFATGATKVVDLECYHRGDYVNDVGRLPGSERFMSPEELTLGATVDTRSTVFNLARAVEIFLLARHDLPAVREVVARATATSPDDRHPTVRAFRDAWRAAAPDVMPDEGPRHQGV